MRALNLYTLTRVREVDEFSRFAQVLSRRSWHKAFGAREAASLCAMVDALTGFFAGTGAFSGTDWLRYFDGFYFSYTIEHISKEFDLLKFSADADCVLNIELKSEEIGEDRIRRQLEQNRYYLSHTSRTILSYTYVMDSNSLYCLNDHGYLRKCGMEELAAAMARPAFRQYIESGIDGWFRAQDYLISPVANPEKLLNGRYFLTNQQAEFRRQILENLQIYEHTESVSGGVEEAESGGGQQAEFRRQILERLQIYEHTESVSEGGQEAESGGGQVAESGRGQDAEFGGGQEAAPAVPVISLTGSAGTGKTLLLFDLALELSRGKRTRVLFLHGGPLREGHRIINDRLRKVTILSGTESGAFPDSFVRTHSYILVDEANRLASAALRSILRQAAEFGIPCILSYDPHGILGRIPAMENAQALIAERETMRLELSGNIRINRPIFSFLRTLFRQKDRGGHVDYDCIDVLYAANRQEEAALTAHYLARGYVLIRSDGSDMISQEYDKVLMTLDRRFYYDGSLRLCADGAAGAAIAPLYEGLSRAREGLCLLIVENSLLFSQILAIRESGRTTADDKA